jgi:hypothetical protein
MEYPWDRTWQTIFPKQIRYGRTFGRSPVGLDLKNEVWARTIRKMQGIAFLLRVAI